MRRACDLEVLVDGMVSAEVEPAGVTEVCDRVAAARQVATDRRHAIRDWLGGGQVEHAWAYLHEAEEELMSLSGVSVDWAIDAARHHQKDLSPSDSSVRTFTDAAKALASAHASRERATAETKVRDRARNLLHNAHEASAARETRIRKVRNRLLLAAFCGAVLAVVLLVAQVQMPDTAFIAAPAGATIAAWQVLAITLLGGLVGGAIGGLNMLTSRNRGRLDLAGARAAQRASMGLITGFAGVLLVSAGWITVGPITSIPTLIVVALAFGYSQELVAKVIDKKLSGVVATR